jgi:hypothetical protein
MVKASYFDRKVDRNADTLQQTTTDVREQDPAPGATGRTATNSHGQSMPNPPFGSPRNFRNVSSKARRSLGCFYLRESRHLTGTRSFTALAPVVATYDIRNDKQNHPFLERLPYEASTMK